MSITDFVIICSEYRIHPQLVADDLHESGIEDLTEERLREWLENNY